MKFLGKIIVVEHKKQLVSDTIAIPDTVRTISGPIEGVVVGIGNKSEHINDISIGDTVLVPVQLGSRSRVPTMPDAIVYDDEDVIAIINA